MIRSAAVSPSVIIAGTCSATHFLILFPPLILPLPCFPSILFRSVTRAQTQASNQRRGSRWRKEGGSRGGVKAKTTKAETLRSSPADPTIFRVRQPAPCSAKALTRFFVGFYQAASRAYDNTILSLLRPTNLQPINTNKLAATPSCSERTFKI